MFVLLYFLFLLQPGQEEPEAPWCWLYCPVLRLAPPQCITGLHQPFRRTSANMCPKMAFPCLDPSVHFPLVLKTVKTLDLNLECLA